MAVGVLSPLYRVQYLLQPKPDRHILERVIFPALLADDSVRRVLFVGCAWYTRGYDRHFRDREFWTIDVDERAARHGAERHIVGSLTAIGDHFPAAGLDAVICSGVVGFGLDTRNGCEAAFDACHRCLRPGGWLIVGWDDVESRRVVPLESLASLRSFRPHPLPPFTSWRYPTFSPLQHTFDFYRRPL